MADHTLWFSASSPLGCWISFNPYVEVKEVVTSSLWAPAQTKVQLAVVVDLAAWGWDRRYSEDVEI